MRQMVDFFWERYPRMSPKNSNDTPRRSFLKCAAAFGGATLFGGGLNRAFAQASPASVWKDQIGLELYTVRDLMLTDFEGVLAKVAEMGYREVEPASGYNNMEPKAFRAMLDRYNLRMPSTHNAARGTGVQLEKQLEGFQMMGIKYTEISGRSGPGSCRRPIRPEICPPAPITIPARVLSETHSRKPKRSDHTSHRSRSSR